MAMAWIIGGVILWAKEITAYNYPLSPEAQDTFKEPIALIKTLCSVSYWMNWFFSPTEPEVVEISQFEEFLSWMGIINAPEVKKNENCVDIAIWAALTLFAVAFIIYMTFTRNMPPVPGERPKLIPYLADTVEFTKNTHTFPEKEKLVTVNTCTGCACQFCMDEVGNKEK